MRLSKSHLQLKIQLLEKHDWDSRIQNRFSAFFNKCRAIFDPDVTADLNSAFGLFQQKWGMAIKTAEYYIWYSRNVVEGQSLYWDAYDYSYGYLIKKAVRVDWVRMESELDYLVTWCWKKINRIAFDLEVDFEQQVEIKKG